MFIYLFFLLQTFKFLIATRLVDHGLLEKGLQYLERTADGIIRYPSRVQASLVSRVCELSDRLKYCDPLQAEDLDSNRADATWLSNLKTILNDFNVSNRFDLKHFSDEL